MFKKSILALSLITASSSFTTPMPDPITLSKVVVAIVTGGTSIVPAIVIAAYSLTRTEKEETPQK
jgi:hypothetical protein